MAAALADHLGKIGLRIEAFVAEPLVAGRFLERISDPRQKAKLFVMADTWELLSDYAKRNSHGNGPGIRVDARL